MKKRPAGVPDVDRDEHFWKQQVDEAVKTSGLKANKNGRDVLNKYLTAVLQAV